MTGAERRQTDVRQPRNLATSCACMLALHGRSSRRPRSRSRPTRTPTRIIDHILANSQAYETSRLPHRQHRPAPFGIERRGAGGEVDDGAVPRVGHRRAQRDGDGAALGARRGARRVWSRTTTRSIVLTALGGSVATPADGHHGGRHRGHVVRAARSSSGARRSQGRSSSTTARWTWRSSRAAARSRRTAKAVDLPRRRRQPRGGVRRGGRGRSAPWPRRRCARRTPARCATTRSSRRSRPRR